MASRSGIPAETSRRQVVGAPDEHRGPQAGGLLGGEERGQVGPRDERRTMEEPEGLHGAPATPQRSAMAFTVSGRANPTAT